MQKSIPDRFHELATARAHHLARGWINVDCPACGDRRQRLGILRTESGGLRIFCYNGGCSYNDPTGWEPGDGLYGRVLGMFLKLGGKLGDIPLTERMKRATRVVTDRRGNTIGIEKELETVTRFPKCDLPEGSDILVEVAKRKPQAQVVLDYLKRRNEILVDKHPFCWSPKHPDYLIIPYLHYGNIVGYLGRHITKASGAGRFIQKAPSDYMFNQDLLFQQEGTYVLVMESPLDAIAIDGVATRGTKPSEKMINLLRISGKEPVMIPDMKSAESQIFLQIAEDNDWPVSMNSWGKNVKDVGDVVRQAGLLFATEQIIKNATTNYTEAKIRMSFNGV